MTSDHSDPATQAGFSGVAHLLRPDALILGRYRLKKKLGRGGFSVVWLAHDEELDVDKAIKFFSDSIVHNAEALEEMKAEVKRGLVLTHPHIVRVHDVIYDDELAGITMEYVDGGTFSDLKARRPTRSFEVEHLERHVAALCDALEYAHVEAQLVHRDLKPANLMLDRRGRLRIADFGISRSIAETHTRLTNTRITSGTLPFMSPQQLAGFRPQVSDDVYAVGATLYDLLTSKPPFYTGLVADQIKNRAPQSVSERRKEVGIIGRPIPERWEETIGAMLAKDPEDRPKSAAEIAVRLGVSQEAASYTAHGAISDTTLLDAAESDGDTSTETVDPHAPIRDPSTRQPAGGEPAAPGGGEAAETVIFGAAPARAEKAVVKESPAEVKPPVGPRPAPATSEPAPAPAPSPAIGARTPARVRPGGGAKVLIGVCAAALLLAGGWFAYDAWLRSPAAPEAAVVDEPRTTTSPTTTPAPGTATASAGGETEPPPVTPTTHGGPAPEPPAPVVPVASGLTPSLVGLDWGGTFAVTGLRLGGISRAHLESPAGRVECEVVSAGAGRVELRAGRRLFAGEYTVVLGAGGSEVRAEHPLVVEPAFRWVQPTAAAEVAIGSDLTLQWEGNVDASVRLALHPQGSPSGSVPIETVRGIEGSTTFAVRNALVPGPYVLTAVRDGTELAARSIRVTPAPVSVVELLLRFRNDQGRGIEPQHVLIDGREHILTDDPNLRFDTTRISLAPGHHSWEVTDRFRRTFSGELLVTPDMTEATLDLVE